MEIDYYKLSEEHIRQNYNCGNAATKRLASLEKYREIFKIHGFKLRSIFCGHSDKVTIECKHGHLRNVHPYTSENGECAGCFLKLPPGPIEYHKNRAQIGQSALLKELNAKGGKLVGSYKSTYTKVKVDCGNGHTFSVLPNNIISKIRKSWCPYCDGQKIEGGFEQRLIGWLTPNGISISHNGLTPDVVVKLDEKKYLENIWQIINWDVVNQKL
jgi:hypothetical protein